MSSQTPNLNLVLPIGTEKVSRQIINDNNTKIDTAVGANSQAIATHNLGTFSSLSALETALDTFGTGLQDSDERKIIFTMSSAVSVFHATAYIGVFSKTYSGRYQLIVSENAAINTIKGSKSSSGWSWQGLATNDYFVVDTVTSDNVNIAAGAREEVSVLVSKTGYTPVGIVGVYTTETQVMSIHSYRISGSYAIISLYNTYNDTRNGKSIVRVLYQKT